MSDREEGESNIFNETDDIIQIVANFQNEEFIDNFQKDIQSNQTKTQIVDCLNPDNVVHLNSPELIEDVDLFNLLAKWGFLELYKEFLEQSITVSRLKVIIEKDLDEIFKKKKLGLKLEFRHKLNIWRKENDIPIPSPCEIPSNYSESTIGRWLSANTEYNTLSPSSSRGSPSPAYDSPNNFSLNEAILASPGGAYVFKEYNKNNKLSDTSRNIIIDAIISWHTQNNKYISRKAFEEISSCIENTFGDKKEIYYNPPKPGTKENPKGRLYTKYYNVKKRNVKLRGTSPTYTENNTATDNTEENITSEEFQDIKSWLRVHSEPWCEVKKKWAQTFTGRRKEILNESSTIKEEKLNSIFVDWPLYKNACGFDLVDIEFELIFPGKCAKLLASWESFKNSIKPICAEKIKDKQNLELLKQLQQAESSMPEDVIIALLLHAVLPPTVKYYSKDDASGKKRKIIKSTIKDSQNSFLLIINTINDLHPEIDKLSRNLKERQQTLQPLIIYCQAKDLESYFVYLDEVRYKFNSFLPAFDICFKLFYVLNLKYPDSCNAVWTFVQKYFFGINLPHEGRVCPNILCLMKDLEKY